MALIDGLLRVSNAQVVTATAPSTNVIDITNARDVGVGELPIYLQIYVTTAFAGGTSLQVQFQGSVDNSTWTTYSESAAIALADLTAGAKLFPIIMHHRATGAAVPRYYRLNYVVVGTMTGGGAITADFVLNRRDNYSYPAGYTVVN